MKIKKKTNKIISILLTTVMIGSIGVGMSFTSFADNITASVTVEPATITSSDEEQTVLVSISFSEQITSVAYGAEVEVPEGWTISKVKAAIKNAAETGGTGSITLGSANNKIGGTFDKIYGTDEKQLPQVTGINITYTVPANATAGDQTVGLRKLKMNDSSGSNAFGVSDGIDSVTTVAVSAAASPSDKKPYTVALSADKTEVSVDGTVNVKLDVLNSYGEKEFNALYGTLTYDKNKFSYNATSSTEPDVNQFNIVNDTENGKLTIKRCGSSVTIAADTPELTLPFTAKAAGSDVAFTLSGVKVDVADNAETNALDAEEVTGSPLKVTVTESVTEPVVSGSSSDYVGSSEANKYQLISATIDQTGYVPTYDGNKMYLVDGTGYATETYYYVIPASETYNSALLKYTEGSATTITKGNDVNQSNLIDINDAQFVYNIYNGISPTANVVERLLLADTNGSMNVQIDDCVPIIKAI
jgi:hypothetical protein